MIRHPKIFWVGVVFLGFGIGAIVIGENDEAGSAARMGPSYFPIVLGGMLAAVGVIGVARSDFGSGEPVGRLHQKELALVLVPVLLFDLLMRGAGVVDVAWTANARRSC
ncbi:hypothetical protein ABIB38_001001 [Massilia sp. UYP11]|uniref:tripartite tricarboxylate transporter TctB family protein n=1 Tax=Massilia sp. UYP11 TaxID=1756385 RepID=UPI003D1C48D6